MQRAVGQPSEVSPQAAHQAPLIQYSETMRPIAAFPLLALLAALGGGLAACTSTDYVVYEFRPRPLTIEVRGPANAGVVARAVVSVLGIVTDAQRQPPGHQVHVRMHLENQSSLPISVESARWLLLSADVVEFAPPIVIGSSENLVPGAAITIDALFPTSPGREITHYDLSSLNLRFGVSYGDATILVSANFERWLLEGWPADTYGVQFYGPYAAWGPPYSYPTTEMRTTIGVGVGF